MTHLDRTTIGELYDAYGPVVFRRCRDILGEEQAALDATQDVFVRALTHGDAFRGEASPMTWLYRVSTNLCLNRLRDRRGRQAKLDEAGRGATEGEGSGDLSLFSGAGLPGARAMERGALVRSLLGKVDEEVRQVAVYFYFDGMTHEEIAGVIGLSRPTVAKRLEQFNAHARRLLRQGDPAPAVGLALLALMLCPPPPWGGSFL